MTDMGKRIEQFEEEEQDGFRAFIRDILDVPEGHRVQAFVFGGAAAALWGIAVYKLVALVLTTI